ncbi:MAG: hypothetical protein EOM12_09900 [Verrucomicrobiae bacterium]|nr:hypothetical protein [Verrucomicrobiae bacterium]
MKIPALLVCAMLWITPTYAYETSGPGKIETRPLAEASVLIPARNVRRSGDAVIVFDIPKNAASLDRRARSVLSAVTLADKRNNERCPLVPSTRVRKDVRSYNPFTGRATIQATFAEARDAERALQSGCVLIDDR